MILQNITRFYGKRITETEIFSYFIDYFNKNTLGIPFKMGFNEQLNWYRPMIKDRRQIDEEFYFDEDAYQVKKINFVPFSLDATDGGFDTQYDLNAYTMTLVATFMLPIEDYHNTENAKDMIEEIRDKLRRHFDILKMTQRPFNKTDRPTKATLKMVAFSGALVLGDELTYANGQRFVSIGFPIDLLVSDSLVFADQFVFEISYKKDDGSYSNYERLYGNLQASKKHDSVNKQELVNLREKNYVLSNKTEYENSYYKNDLGNIDITAVNLSRYLGGTILKTNANTYYKVVNADGTTPFEEMKSVEITSTPDTTSFGLSGSLVFRDRLPHETDYVLGRLFNDIFNKRYGYSLYKIRLNMYDLVFNELDEKVWVKNEYFVGFERTFILDAVDTSFEFGVNVPIGVSFLPSDRE